MQTSLKYLRQHNSFLISSLWKWVVEAPTTQLVLTNRHHTTESMETHANNHHQDCDHRIPQNLDKEKLERPSPIDCPT